MSSAVVAHPSPSLSREGWGGSSLILVIMEYKWNNTNYAAEVLVLMDYKWNTKVSPQPIYEMCLNPCFNGIQMEPCSAQHLC